MLQLPRKKFKKNGQTLIGILVALAIFSILSQAIFTVISASFNFVSYNRARITARHLAQEKMEYIRNLPYDDVGTAGGIPSGPIPQTENIIRNKLNLQIKTTIIYVDDPFDEQVPSDLLGTDYKRVRVEVSWEGLTSSRNSPLVFVTDVAPKGVETTAGGGTLSIVVFDADGDPVPQADVTIIATAVSPAVNLSLNTAENGRIILPGATPCVACYQISVAKNGYSQERTYSTSEVANPNKPHQTVLEGQLTEISFAIDQTSEINIATKEGRENNFQMLPNTSFRLRGQKTIGTDSSAQAVYKYDEVLSTDSLGGINLTDIEWGNYQLTLPAESPYDISGTNPLQPISIIPNTSSNFSISLSPNTANSLLLSFVDSASNPIASVSATLSNGSPGESKFSGGSEDPDFGQVFFPDLENQNYNILATASGYLDYNGVINISGDTAERIILTSE